MRPFEIITEAETASQEGNSVRAEALFQDGIRAYKRDEPDGIDFALGRYGAFLIEQGRTEDAAEILEEAIGRNTDIPRIWADYLRIITDRRDLNAFKECVERKDGPGRFEAEFLLSNARRAYREGASDFAKQLVRWIIDRATRDSDLKTRWAAIGDLGRILERDGDLEQALGLWRGAFDEGSCDAETANRLSMHLERMKDCAGAVTVIHQALTRQLPASVEESLRKRLARCTEKPVGRSCVKRETRADIQAFSIREDMHRFELLFQVRLKHSISDIRLINNLARCLFSSHESSMLIDFDVTNGHEVRKIENLPILSTLYFAPEGHSIGLLRTAAVGQGPTLLRFFNAEGHMTAEASVPDATSEIAPGADMWNVGCRDGFLYGFGLDGKRRWAWETPGVSGHKENVYFRPCPYYVASNGSLAAVSSMGNIYAVAPNGKTIWQAHLPNERQTHWSFTIPLNGGEGIRQPYSVLGLQADATREEVKSAYRRLALATHPDRNPDDTDANARFRRVQEAYERILAGGLEEGAAGITVSIEIQGGGPLVSSIAVKGADVIVGSSNGRLYVFNTDGSLREARVLGDSAAKIAFRDDQTLGAAWCGNALLWFRQNEIISAAEYPGWPHGLTMLGDDVVLWHGNEVQVMNTAGKLLSLEFSKRVRAVVTCGDTFLCAGGVLAAFKRR